MIKLGRMLIENFKSFIEPMIFDFTDRDLVLFDGPNGFGKTTIFDAVELCFTGQISRIKHTDIKSKKDHILKGDNGKPTTIKLELLNGDETLLVIGIYIPADISGAQGKVSKYRDVIDRFESEQWLDNLVTDSLRSTPLDIKKLKQLLENEKLDSTFTLFNYIQQEETCHFLKLDENKRHQQISHLFGTIEETNKAIKLDALKTKVKEEIDAYTPKIADIGNELAELSKPNVQKSDEETILGSGKISVLADLSSSTVEQLNSYKNNLEGVDWVLKNFSKFNELKFNYLLKEITTKRTAELDSFVKVGIVESYQAIVKLNKHYLIWKKTCKKATSYNDLIRLFDGEPSALSKDILDKYREKFPKYYDMFATDIATFNALLLTNSSFNSLIVKIEGCRKSLLSHYRGHIGHDESKEHEGIPCPLCGDIKPEWQDLLDEYDVQTKRFDDQLGENGKLLAEVTKRLIKELVTPLVVKMKRFTAMYEQYISINFETLIKVKYIEKTDFDRMVRVRSWLNTNVGDCSSFLDGTLFDINQDYGEVKDQLIRFINSHKKLIEAEVPKEYPFYVQDLKVFNLAFDENDRLSIDESDITKDLTLLSRLMVQQSSASYKAKEKELSLLRTKVKKLTQKRGVISAISSVFNDEIKAYEKAVAKHIAIPLFVYSSKILQSRPEGSGVFLITPERGGAKGFIQFSATPNDSHDAWNTMSSGQLAGVVISFMLAMNKVYPPKLSTIMIDDPVQTMDEVNMASFVQLMRYEFPDMQILLSTHESKVANYINYKYSEAGLKTLPINMKDKRLELVES
ncbi:AAA family ATPase [Shewanella sp. YLB-07]|uniref:AAA family ATPase n=1 Tax=Shewanella sp. YLB-07 TaxID=2601268 RepID=UPI00128C7E1F|nr:AAA family ATPase [Shewanella sp. YLB-07]MPY24425.1 AAA family ATPase [Shewanella sp. YLB-07]